MKYVPSMYIGQLSRSQGGTTASRNRFGSYFRNRSTPVNPDTSLQQVQRLAMAAAGEAWRALSGSERSGWSAIGEEYSRQDSLGQTYSLTGFQAYVAAVRNCTYIGVSVPASPPEFSIPASPLTITSAPSDAAFSVVFTPTPVPTGVKFVIEATGPMSAGVSFAPRSAFKKVAVVNAAGTSPVDVLSAYTALYGAPIPGMRVFVRIRAISLDGFAGPHLETSAVVTTGG